MDNLKLINLTLLSRFKEKIDVLLEKKVNKTDIATTEQLGLIKPDGNTILIDEDGVLSSVGVSNVKEKELLLSEYQALSKEEKNNDTSYYITDADNISDVNSVGTAGSLKPWLYNSDEEVVVGVYDGKPLYRKTLQVQTINQTITQEYSLADYGIDNVCEIKCFDGFIKNDSSGSLVMLNYYLDNNDFCGSWLSVGNVFKISHTASLYGVATINFEYTKTTDAENSGNNLMPYSFVQNSGGCNYSTEEQVVGTWIDGRPIYQKSYSAKPDVGTTLLLDNTIKHLTHTLTDVKGTWVIGDFTFDEDTNQTSLFSSITFDGVETKPPNIELKRDGLYVKSNTDIYGFEMNITIQYTKTTN